MIDWTLFAILWCGLTGAVCFATGVEHWLHMKNKDFKEGRGNYTGEGKQDTETATMELTAGDIGIILYWANQTTDHTEEEIDLMDRMAGEHQDLTLTDEQRIAFDEAEEKAWQEAEESE